MSKTWEEFWQSELERLWSDLQRQMDVLEKQIRLSLQLTNPAVGVNLHQFDPNLPEFIATYGFEMVSGINASTAKSLREIFDEYIRGGHPHSWLVKRIQQAGIFSAGRAKKIAMTESTRIYAQTNLRVWEKTPWVYGKKWFTAMDEKVCPVCGGLEGKVVEKMAQFSVDVANPPAHVNCRCAIRPAVNPDLYRVAPALEALPAVPDPAVLEDPIRKSAVPPEESNLSLLFDRVSEENAKLRKALNEFFRNLIEREKSIPEHWMFAQRLKSFISLQFSRIFESQGIRKPIYVFNSWIKAWAISSNDQTLSIALQYLAHKIFKTWWPEWQNSKYAEIIGDGLESLKEAAIEKFKNSLSFQFDVRGVTDKKGNWNIERIQFILFEIIPEELNFYGGQLMDFGGSLIIEEILQEIKSDAMQTLTTEKSLLEFIVNKYSQAIVQIVTHQEEFLREMYRYSQETLKDILPEYVTLFRGFNVSDEDLAKFPPGEVVEYRGNAMESWSFSMSVASNFGFIIVCAQIPRSRIIGSCYTGFGCHHEQEFVVLGTAVDRVLVIKNGRYHLVQKGVKKSMSDTIVYLGENGYYVVVPGSDSADWLHLSGNPEKEMEEWGKLLAEQTRRKIDKIIAEWKETFNES